MSFVFLLFWSFPVNKNEEIMKNQGLLQRLEYTHLLAIITCFCLDLRSENSLPSTHPISGHYRFDADIIRRPCK